MVVNVMCWLPYKESKVDVVNMIIKTKSKKTQYLYLLDMMRCCMLFQTRDCQIIVIKVSSWENYR